MVPGDLRDRRILPCQDVSMASKPRFRTNLWAVQELVAGQWKTITPDPLARFSQAVKIYDAAKHKRRLLRNGKPLPASPNAPHPALFEE